MSFLFKTLKVLLWIFFFQYLNIRFVFGGCCNANFWCDGDPSFIDVPKIIQQKFSREVRISWTDSILHLAKCVDYFYIEHAQVANGTDPMNTTGVPIKYSSAPVLFEMKKFLDEWEDSMRPLTMVYYTKIHVEYDTNYIFRAVAVDKGTGDEGSAIVFSRAVHYHSKPYQRKPTEEEIVRQSIEAEYPSAICNKQQFCKNFAFEWVKELTQRAIHESSVSVDKHDPENIPPINIRSGKNRQYNDGKIYNLDSVDAEVTGIYNTTDGSHWLISIDVRFRLLRIAYHWDSFLMEGILSMYHTCGKRLPMTMIHDVDEDEVEEFTPEGCHLLTKVNLVVPKEIGNTNNNTNLIIPQVASVVIQNFKRDQFKYDATWFTKRFHNFRALWIKQSSIVQDKISSIIKDSFEKELIDFDVDEWVLKKLISLQERINLAKNSLNMMTTANDSANSMMEENIDPGLIT